MDYLGSTAAATPSTSFNRNLLFSIQEIIYFLPLQHCVVGVFVLIFCLDNLPSLLSLGSLHTYNDAADICPGPGLASHALNHLKHDM